MKLFETSAYNSIFKHHKPEKINGAFNEKHIEYKKVMEMYQSSNTLKRLKHIWVS